MVYPFRETNLIPLGSFIVKTTAFCNLNCSYCYMFNLEDRSYQGRPKVMPPDVVDAAASGIPNYAVANRLDSVRIIFHGGEPLLAGTEWFRRAIDRFEQEAAGRFQYTYALQTNGVLVDAKWLELFRERRIRASVSMDGPRKTHDRGRVDHHGRGSYDEVVRGLRLLLDAPDEATLFGGVLCVIDPAEDGLATYRHFRELGVTRLDFLQPLERNWDNVAAPGMSDTPIADYLIPIFDEWWEERDVVDLRYFRDILDLHAGGECRPDNLGGFPLNFAVIESDGSLEPLDALRACGDAFTQLGLNVLRDRIDAVYDQPLFQTAMAGAEGLSHTCRSCYIGTLCGGGYLPNRYSRARGFDNPSVYCRDLWQIILHVVSVAAERPPALAEA